MPEHAFKQVADNSEVGVYCKRKNATMDRYGMENTENASGSSNNTAQPRFDTSLLALLVCPVTKAALVYDESGQELISRQAGLAFPIRNGIPVLLKEDARVLSLSPAETVTGA